MDERKARVIELRYFTGLDREEVAEALGLTLATVKRDIRRGEAWLRRFLGDSGRRSEAKEFVSSEEIVGGFRFGQLAK